MAQDEDQLRRSENQSMRKSRVGNRYFRIDAGYDKAVYENTFGNWMRILGTFAVFYTVVAFFWWAVFSHGIRHVDSATWIYIGVLLVSWFIIFLLILFGHFSNKKMMRVERLTLEINEEKKKKREEEEKKQKREEAKKEMKKLQNQQFKDSESAVNASRSDYSGSESGAQSGVDSEDESNPSSRSD